MKKLFEEVRLLEGYETVIQNYIENLGVTQDSLWSNGIFYVTRGTEDEVRKALDAFDNISTVPKVRAIEDFYGA